MAAHAWWQTRRKDGQGRRAPDHTSAPRRRGVWQTPDRRDPQSRRSSTQLAGGQSMELTVVVRPEGQWYWSEVRQLPGCIASGRTLEELREALGEAIGLYVWDKPVSLGDQDLRVGEVEVVVAGPDAE